MPGASKKRERREREKALFAEPDNLEGFLDFIAAGGTLGGWCAKHDVRFRAALAWLEATEQRKAAYALAIEARRQSLKDEFVDGVVSIVRQDVRKLYDKDGAPLKVHQLPADLAANTTGLKTTPVIIVAKDGSTERVDHVVDEVKTISRQAGLEMLGKMTGASGAERVELTGKDGGPIDLNAVRSNLGKMSTSDIRVLFDLLTKMGLAGGNVVQGQVLKLPQRKTA